VSASLTQMIAREFAINRGLSLRQASLLLIVALVAAVTGGAAGGLRALIVLAFSLNVFFPMIYFTNLYLQQSKDRELQHLATLPVGQGAVIAAKVMYVVLAGLAFNVPLFLTLGIATGASLVCVNAFVLCTSIATSVGTMLLALFLFLPFEQLLGYSQHVRLGIVLVAVSVLYVVRFDPRTLTPMLEYGPLPPLVAFAGLLYAVYRLLVHAYLNKRSYL